MAATYHGYWLNAVKTTMQLKPPFKKLFFVSLYTSPITALLLVTPMFMLNKFAPVTHVQVVSTVTLIVFLNWAANILLTGIAYKWQPAKKYHLLLSYTMCIVFIPLFQQGFSPLVGNAGPKQVFHLHLIIFFSVNTVILVIQDLILTREKNAAIEMENAQLKMKSLEAVNERLKQQIHPHFLFNSLSTLKTLICSSPEKAEEYLIQLAGFLRYGLSSNTLNTVKVLDELNACVSYLEMQKIRFGDALQFEFDVPEKIKTGYWMPIFSLQVPAENAIKHNAFTLAQPLVLNITYEGNHIIVRNNIQPKVVAEASAGIGLANLNERYTILSGERIEVQRLDGMFLVRLKVFDNENCDNRR